MAAFNQHGTRHELRLEDLRVVFTELYTVRGQWYNLGLQLKVKVQDLQKIETEYKNDHGTCLRQMLTKWLESGRGNWETLCQAIDSPIVRGDDNLLVAKLRGKFCQSDEGEKQVGKKRPAGGMESTVTDTVTSKKAKGALPDTFDPENFVNPPSSDRRCVKCGRVPANPQCSACCHLVYCEPCSSAMTSTFCPTHQIPLRFAYDKILRQRIMELRSGCPNSRNGCDFKDAVSKVYRQHLPECQHQGGHSTTSSLNPSPAATNEAGVSRPYIGAGTSKIPSTSDFDNVKPKAKVTPLKCKYHRIGCWGKFATKKKMEQHLLDKVQLHLDLAIGKIEQLMDQRET